MNLSFTVSVDVALFVVTKAYMADLALNRRWADLQAAVLLSVVQSLMLFMYTFGTRRTSDCSAFGSAAILQPWAYSSVYSVRPEKPVSRDILLAAMQACSFLCNHIQPAYTTDGTDVWDFRPRPIFFYRGRYHRGGGEGVVFVLVVFVVVVSVSDCFYRLLPSYFLSLSLSLKFFFFSFLFFSFFFFFFFLFSPCFCQSLLLLTDLKCSVSNIPVEGLPKLETAVRRLLV